LPSLPRSKGTAKSVFSDTVSYAVSLFINPTQGGFQRTRIDVLPLTYGLGMGTGFRPGIGRQNHCRRLIYLGCGSHRNDVNHFLRKL
jgi:hypothetical protein